MCVIVDANVACLVFTKSPDRDFLPVLQWIADPDKHGRLVYGGELARELLRVGTVARYLRELQRAGRAILIPDEKVRPEEKRVTDTGICRSDDPHVIALARASGARTLCSRDGDLHHDFKNPNLISSPRGSVYQTPQHAHLLRHTTSCGRVG